MKCQKDYFESTPLSKQAEREDRKNKEQRRKQKTYSNQSFNYINFKWIEYSSEQVEMDRIR